MSSKFKVTNTNAPSGAQICLYQMSGGKNAKGVVHINHGMAEHGARYERFANALVKAGYHVIVHDHRGHGKTTAVDAPLGVFSNENGLTKTIADIHHVNQFAQQKYPNLPVIFFGHSMGTILGLNYCIQHSDTISAAAFWNAGFDTGALAVLFKVLLKIERMFKGSDVASTIGSKLTFEDWNKKFKPNRTVSDWLSRDKSEVDKYVADPLCGFAVSTGLWLDVLDAVYYGADDKNLRALPDDLPLHLQAGLSDPCTLKGTAVKNLANRLKNLGKKNVTLNLLTDTRHESLNEINRDETTSNFITWLDGNFG